MTSAVHRHSLFDTLYLCVLDLLRSIHRVLKLPLSNCRVGIMLELDIVEKHPQCLMLAFLTNLYPGSANSQVSANILWF